MHSSFLASSHFRANKSPGTRETQACLFLRIVMLMFPLFLVIACNNDSGEKQSLRNVVSYSSRGVPSLVFYYLDCGRFPSSNSGWKAMYENPYSDNTRTQWKGPYLNKDLFLSNEGICMRLLNGCVRYDCLNESQVAVLTLYEDGAAHACRTIRLFKRSANDKTAEPSSVTSGYKDLLPLTKAITEYKLHASGYPSYLEDLAKKNPGIRATIEALERKHVHLHYGPLYGRDGFTLFFRGADIDFDVHLQFLFIPNSDKDLDVFVAYAEKRDHD